VGSGIAKIVVWCCLGVSALVGSEPEAAKALDAMALKLEPSPGFILTPYNATYRIEMAENMPDMRGFDGDMSVEFYEEDNAWVYGESGSGQLALASGSVIPMRWSYRMREARDGTRFTFNYIVQRGKKTVCHNQGSVQFDPLSQAGTVTWVKPYTSTVSITHEMIFPVGFMKKMMAGVRDIPCTLSAHVFDGKTRKLLPAVSCFISEPRRVRWRGKAGGNRHLTVWPVFQALYREEKEGEQLLPTSRHQFLMTQRGLPLKASRIVEGIPMVCTLRSLGFKAPAAKMPPARNVIL
jgi:hypothetical protein